MSFVNPVPTHTFRWLVNLVDCCGLEKIWDSYIQPKSCLVASKNHSRLWYNPGCFTCDDWLNCYFCRKRAIDGAKARSHY